MALPQVIQDQIDRAEQMEQQFVEAQAGNTQTDPQTQPNDPPPTEPKPTVAPEGDAARAPAPVSPDLEQQHKTLMGKYNAEVPRLHEQLRQRDAQAAEMQRRLEQLEQARKEPEHKPEPTVTNKDEDAFGADLIDLSRRVAKEEFSKMLGPILAEIDHRLSPVKEKVGQVEQQQALNSQDRFVQALTQAVPDWEAINTNQDWLTWLTEFDPFAGVTRQVALDEAARSMDARRTSAIFQAWKNTQTLAAAPAAQTNTAKRELERQAAPQKSKGSTATVNPADKIWTVAEYQAAFDPRLAQTSSPEEAARMQADADKAWDEGRIRP
jgi:hypothetical protein